jgi:transcriptional regulator
MYIPQQFIETDLARIHELMQRNSFATIITQAGEAPFATHMPVLLDGERGPHGTLVSHMARANEQWRHFADGGEVLVIFHGPHAYVSPSWYETRPAVPTWNYAAVHAYGVPRIIEDAASLRAMLRELVQHFEAGRPQPWGADLTDEYLDKLSPGIVGLEIPITRLEGKFKLSQNRNAVDKGGVTAALARSPDQTEREVAAMMGTVGVSPSRVVQRSE